MCGVYRLGVDSSKMRTIAYFKVGAGMRSSAPWSAQAASFGHDGLGIE